MDITTTPEWAALQAVPRPAHLRELFAADPERAARYTTVVGDLRVDWSKNLIDDAVVSAMLDVVRASAFHDRRAAMFRGEPINATERRAVLHTALRAPLGTHVEVDGHDVVPEVHAVLDRMGAFAETAIGAGDHVLLSPIGCGRVPGRVPRVCPSAPSSTSASGAATSARRWRTSPPAPSVGPICAADS